MEIAIALMDWIDALPPVVAIAIPLAMLIALHLLERGKTHAL